MVCTLASSNLRDLHSNTCPCMPQALLAKQGRSAQFNSAADRDAYLRGEVSQLEEARAKLVGTRTELQAEAQSLNGELMDISQVSMKT